jgi:intracellular multiplication protein IcmL
MICVIIFLSSVLVYLVRHPTKPLYFATDSIGRLIPIIPENVPNMSTKDVTAWVISTATSSLSYDFINYRAQFQSAEKYFTQFGWNNYMKAVQAANNLPAVKFRKMIVVAQLAGQPKIIKEGILAGTYAWQFEIPMLLVYMLPPYDEKSKIYNPVLVSVIIQRQPILKSYQGLGIVQLLVESSVSTSNQPQEMSSAPPT